MSSGFYNISEKVFGFLMKIIFLWKNQAFSKEPIIDIFLIR